MTAAGYIARTAETPFINSKPANLPPAMASKLIPKLESVIPLVQQALKLILLCEIVEK